MRDPRTRASAARRRVTGPISVATESASRTLTPVGAAVAVRGVLMSRRAPIVHVEPMWLDRADFVIWARTKQDEGDVPEQLWAKRLGARRFQLCCIPFFAYDLALDDVVETDDAHLITNVIHRSGRYVFRVWFEDNAHQERTIAQLQVLGSLIERSSAHLVAVDAAGERMAQEVAGFLEAQEAAGVLTFERGGRRSPNLLTPTTAALPVTGPAARWTPADENRSSSARRPRSGP